MITTHGKYSVTSQNMQTEQNLLLSFSEEVPAVCPYPFFVKTTRLH